MQSGWSVRLWDVVGGEPRKEWDSVDLRYRDITIEVKAAGLSQSWSLHSRSSPKFNIAPRKQAWDAATDTWETFDPPRRSSDVYVFCLHTAAPATNENVLDPGSWKFWVIPARVLDAQLGAQKTAVVSTLNRLAAPVGWSELRSEIDRYSN